MCDDLDNEWELFLDDETTVTNTDNVIIFMIVILLQNVKIYIFRQKQKFYF